MMRLDHTGPPQARSMIGAAVVDADDGITGIRRNPFALH
jgi:hypothetical protein